MAKFSPLGNLLKSFTKENEEEKLTNLYDDGSVWTLPEEEVVSEQYSSPIKNLLSSNTITPGALEAFNSLQDVSDTIDPLQSSRNQMNYYTRQLNELGQEVEKPSILQKSGSVLGKALDIAFAAPNSIGNAVTGLLEGVRVSNEQTQSAMESTSAYQKLKDMGLYIDNGTIRDTATNNPVRNNSEANALYKEAWKETKGDRSNALDYVKNIGKESVSSFLNTWKGVVDEDAKDKVSDIYNIIDRSEKSDTDSSKYIKDTSSGAKFALDIATSFGLSGLDINDAGKTIKSLRNADKLDGIAKVNKLDDALEIAKKYNNYDDFVESLGKNASKYSDEKLASMFENSIKTYAKDLTKDVNKGLGGINNFEGLKLGNKVILDTEKIAKISTNKLQRNLLQVGLGVYSPVGALMSNPITDGIGKAIDKTETGTALKNDVNKLFKNGKKNEWINSMKNNPEDALKYANERKQSILTKKLSDDRIQKTMETINKYSDMKETPEEITKIIEEPTTRRTREIQVEREINNPEYISKMMNLGKEEYNKQLTSLETMKNKLVQQKEDLLKTGKKADLDKNAVSGLDSEISNIQKRIDKVSTVEKAKSLDFNKQMKKFGYEDDYTELFDKAIKTDIEDLAKEVGDRDLAEALQESANRVLDTLDEQFDGLSDYFTSYSKIDKNKVLTGEVYDYFGSPEEIREFSNLTSEQGLEKARQKLELALDEDKLNGKSTELSNKKIKYSTELVRKYQQDFIRDKLGKLGIKIKSGDEYDKMISSLDMTPGDDFINMLKSKEEYIAKSEAKAFKNKAIREHLGTEGKSLEQDLINLAKKRINEGGDTYTLKHTKNFKDTNASKKQTKIKSLEDFRVYKGKSANVKNTLKPEQSKAMAKQILFEEGEIQKYRIYDKTIDTKLKETVKVMKETLPDDTTSYVMKKDAKNIAKKFIEESGLDLDYNEVASRIDRLSYKEIKKELVQITYEKKEEALEQYSKYVNALGDDEIELLKAQQSARRLQPQDVFGDFEVKDGQLVKANTKDVKSASFDKFKTESKKMSEAYVKAEMAKKDAGVLFEKSKNNTDDVLGVERGTPFEEAGKNISVTGKDREKWVDDLEAKRSTKTQGYDGNMSTSTVNSQKDIMSREEILKADVNKRETQIRVDNAKLEQQAKIEQETIKKAEEEAKKLVPIDTKTPLGKAVNQSLPDSMKDMVGIKLNTANGEIVIDKNMNITELKKILSDSNYGKAEKGSKIIYTNTPIKNNGAIGTYVKDSDTIMINVKSLNKTQMQTVLEHEIGHRTMNKLLKQFPNATDERVAMSLLEYIPKLDDKAKEKFISIMERANKGNSATKEMIDIGIVSKYMNDVSLDSDVKTMTQEGYAELFSLYNNKNSVVAKGMKNLDENAYNQFIKHMDSLPNEEVVEVSKLVRKRFGDESANKLLELQNKKETLTTLHDVMKKASDINKTNIEIDTIKEGLNDLEKAMDSHTFDEAGNVVSTDYDTFFNKMKEVNPEAVEEINKSSERYKKLFDMEEEIFEIDNTKNLSSEAKEFIEEYKKTMKDIALREGIYDETDAEAFTTYVMHMINPKFTDEADIVEKGRKIKAELSDPLNVHALNRKNEGTIEELNKASYNQTGKRIYEENINRLLLKRAVDSEKNILAKNQTKRILEEFSIPIVRNFDTHVNSSEHLMEHYGDAIAEKLGVNKNDIPTIFKESEKTSKEFMKEHFLEDFEKQLPSFETMDVPRFKDYLEYKFPFEDKEGINLDKGAIGKMINDLKKGNTDGIIDVLFEEEYPMVNKFKFADSLRKKYGYDKFIENPLDNIPMYTDDGRKYVRELKKDLEGNIIKSKVDRTKQMPYDIEGKLREKSDPIKAYNEFVYKTSKEQNMIMVELPRENPEKIVKRVITNKAMEDIVKDRTTLAEKISDMMTGDKEAIEGFDALAGYNVVDPKKITLEEFSVDNGAERVLIDRDAWANYQKAIKDAEYKDKNALLKVYDYFNNMFKSQAIFSGAFHIRNGIQNTVASYVKTGANLLDPRKNKEALEILLYKNDKLKSFTKEYGGYNIDEILEQAEKSGIFETEMKNEFIKDTTNKFLKGEVDNLEVKKVSKLKQANPFSTEFIGYKASQKLGGAIEEQAKVINIITHLENGFDLSDAIDLTKETLFDYSELTEFESKVMRRAFPFYTFMRKNIPSQIDNLANHSARAGRIQSIYDKSSRMNETDKERDLRPEYLDGQLSIGNQKFLNIGNATDDLNKLINPLELGSGLNPLIKTPIELLFNKQMYSGSDISRYDKNVEKAKYFVESSVPITRQVNALHKLITGTEAEQTKATKTLSRTIGNLVNSYDIEKQEKSTMYDYVEQLQNQYYEYLEKHPEAKAELEAEKNKSTKANYVSPLSKLIKKR